MKLKNKNSLANYVKFHKLQAIFNGIVLIYFVSLQTHQFYYKEDGDDSDLIKISLWNSMYAHASAAGTNISKTLYIQRQYDV